MSIPKHLGFIQVNQFLEEEGDPIKDVFTFKEVMASAYKAKFKESMETEIPKHTNSKHWTYYKKDDMPLYETLRSMWTFRIKRNRSTGEVVKIEACFYDDGQS